MNPLDTIRRDVALMMKQVHNHCYGDRPMMHPDDYADQRNGVDLMRRHVNLRHVATAAAVIYLGTLSWIGHVAWLVQWAGN